MKFLTGALIALVASTAAFAQPGPHSGMMGGQGPMTGEMGMMGGMMGHCAMMRRSEGALAFLKTELAITPAQAKAWDAFAAAYRAEAANKPRGQMMGGPGGGMMKRGAGGAQQAFPEAVAQHVQMMESRLAGTKRLMDTAKPLYDALNAEQRKSADELLAHFIMMRCPMM
jgi:hypothetical protein